MLKKQADLLKKEQSKLANQFTEVSEEQALTWHPLDAIAFVMFVGFICLFFV